MVIISKLDGIQREFTENKCRDEEFSKVSVKLGSVLDMVDE